MTQVAVVYHSGYGHTARVAQFVQQGAQSVPGVEAHLISVNDVNDPTWELLAKADAIIFGSPTYMGGASADFKKFADASSKVWFSQGWKNKVAGGFTNSMSMSGDKLSTLQYFVTFAMQHGMVWVGSATPGAQKPGDPTQLNRVGSWVGVMTQADNAPAEVTPPQADLDTASLYGARVAEFAKRLGQ
ncbi:flavodoxin family protein [Limnobacter humi]|uniref:Flavoprotein WrbA n=1 Tax=Limnobacter humi TaxID=1778671 RepID=A0ABT1WCA7_9BURK|nr:flavodoxin family protein [Limnobacter humi]MCQ8895151.1 flavodoxin family protein [Limnobacter humi]